MCLHCVQCSVLLILHCVNLSTVGDTHCFIFIVCDVCCLPCGTFLYYCVFVMLLVLEVGLVLGWCVFGVVSPECGCEGGFMAGGVLEELQRSCWGIWCDHLSDGYCVSILCKCKNVLLCWGVTLCFAIVGVMDGVEWVCLFIEVFCKVLKCDCLS